MKIIFIEGARNIGKTYLIDKLTKGILSYKFPFAKYFNESFTKDISDTNKKELNSKRELYYLTLGYDITILDLAKNGLISQDLIVDRGMLSNIIFGIQSGRISITEGMQAWEWLCTEYGDIFEIVYIKTKLNDDKRNKDMWDIYDQAETMSLYETFIEAANTHIYTFENKFDINSVDRFNTLIDDIFYESEEIPGR